MVHTSPLSTLPLLPACNCSTRLNDMGRLAVSVNIELSHQLSMGAYIQTIELCLGENQLPTYRAAQSTCPPNSLFIFRVSKARRERERERDDDDDDDDDDDHSLGASAEYFGKC